jgi:hypothetical protein
VSFPIVGYLAHHILGIVQKLNWRKTNFFLLLGFWHDFVNVNFELWTRNLNKLCVNLQELAKWFTHQLWSIWKGFITIFVTFFFCLNQGYMIKIPNPTTHLPQIFKFVYTNPTLMGGKKIIIYPYPLDYKQIKNCANLNVYVFLSFWGLWGGDHIGCILV